MKVSGLGRARRPAPRPGSGAGLERGHQLGDPPPVGAQRGAQPPGGRLVGEARAERMQDLPVLGSEFGDLAAQVGAEVGAASQAAVNSE